MDITRCCKKYFQGPSKLQFKESPKLSVLKIATYFTIIGPLVVGIVLGAATLGSKCISCCRDGAENETDEKTNRVSTSMLDPKKSAPSEGEINPGEPTSPAMPIETTTSVAEIPERQLPDPIESEIPDPAEHKPEDQIKSEAHSKVPPVDIQNKEGVSLPIIFDAHKIDKSIEDLRKRIANLETDIKNHKTVLKKEIEKITMDARSYKNSFSAIESKFKRGEVCLQLEKGKETRNVMEIERWVKQTAYELALLGSAVTTLQRNWKRCSLEESKYEEIFQPKNLKNQEEFETGVAKEVQNLFEISKEFDQSVEKEFPFVHRLFLENQLIFQKNLDPNAWKCFVVNNNELTSGYTNDQKTYGDLMASVTQLIANKIGEGCSFSQLIEIACFGRRLMAYIANKGIINEDILCYGEKRKGYSDTPLIGVYTELSDYYRKQHLIYRTVCGYIRNEINNESAKVHLSKIDTMSIKHTESHFFDKVMPYIEEMFTNSLTLQGVDLERQLGEFFWWWCQLKPISLGDPSVGEMLFKAVLMSKNKEIPGWANAIIPWVKVMKSLDPVQFGKKFTTLFARST